MSGTTEYKINAFRFVDLNQENFYRAVQPNITTNKNGIVWFNSSNEDEDNAYTAKIIDYAKNKSAVHSNLLNLKANLFYGSGLYPIDETSTATWDFIRKQNKAGDDLNGVFKKMCTDASWFEAGAYQAVYDAGGRIPEVYHTDVSKLRAQEPNSFGYVEKWYFNDTWGIIENAKAKRSNNTKDAIEIPSFNIENGVSDKRQINYIKNYKPGNDVYAIPTYNSGLPWVQIEWELAQFHLSKIQSGFFPSSIVTMFGNPSEDEQNKFVTEFKKKYAGSKNTGKNVFVWVDGQGNAPKVERLSEDVNSKMFDSLLDMAAQRIAASHSGDLTLSGLDSKGSDLGGDRNKAVISRLAFIEHVVIPMQTVLLTGINKIFKANGLSEVTVFNPPLKITQPEPQDNDLTRTERREMLWGLEPHPDDVVSSTSPLPEIETPSVPQ